MPGAQNLGVDHDHSTQLVRGMLCSKCNSILGFEGDSLRILTGAWEED